MKTPERQWTEIKEMLRGIQAASGIQLLNAATGEPAAGAYVLMGMALLLPLFLASEVSPKS